MDNSDFDKYFRIICIPEIMRKVKTTNIPLNGRNLEWEVVHEILAFHRFDPRYSIDEICRLSRGRYELIDELWTGKTDEESLNQFYVSTAKVLPWGHGMFLPDHEVHARRKTWMKRVALLDDIMKIGAKTVLDYGAGCGHTSSLARAMGFKTVVHHEFSVFHPFVEWRQSKLGMKGGEFIFSDAQNHLSINNKVDAVICTDVAEHVYDPEAMLDEINGVMNDGGILAWISVFGEGIKSHLHPHLKGNEMDLMKRHGFTKIDNFPGGAIGFSGIFRKES